MNLFFHINVTEYRRVDQQRTIQRNWEQDEEKKPQKHYVLNPTICKQTHIT
jgi:hypothetical protein